MFGERQAFDLETVPQTDALYARWDDHEGDSEIEGGYRRYIRFKWVFIGVCIAAVLALVGVSVTVGEYRVGFLESYGIIIDHIVAFVQNLLGMEAADPLDPLKDHVVWNLRLPRILVAIIAGVGLAVAGAAMQSTLKNPLADPYTTGISSGAGFGATLAICYGAGIAAGNAAIVINAFIFSLVPTAMIIAIAAARKVSPTSMILAGIAVMYIFNALTTVMMLWADPDSMAAVYSWQVGTFEGIMWEDLPAMFLVTLVGSLALMLLSNKLNVLSAGDDSARSLGIDASKLRIIVLVVVSLVTASIVSFTGIIGFVGLVAPHVARIFIGSDNRYLIPASAAFGAALLLVSDLVGRTVIAPAVLQVGVVTAFLGGPLFLYLIVRQRKEAW